MHQMQVRRQTLFNVLLCIVNLKTNTLISSTATIQLCCWRNHLPCNAVHADVCSYHDALHHSFTSINYGLKSPAILREQSRVIKAEAGTGSPVTFFVSKQGSDSNTGTIGSPFQTLHGAQAAVRALGKDRPAVTVYVRGVRRVCSRAEV